MRIIPVIDLLGGVVVRGVAGRRSEYRPIESRLCRSASPQEVAGALAEHFHPAELYVADLDAIGGAEPAWEVYERLAELPVRLLVDAGTADLGRASALAQFGAGERGLEVVAGLESVASPALLAELIATVGPERLIFSLDLKNGTPLTTAAAWQKMSANDIAVRAITAGIRRLIVLDLADVGTGQGVGTLALCRSLHTTAPQVELIGGGGVRDVEDLGRLSRAGCSAGLVASALHDGRIRREMLAAL